MNTVRDVLDRVEQRLSRQHGLTRRRIPDRLDLTALLTHSINTLLRRERWPWGEITVNPLIQTRTGEREYLLPKDFRNNFVEGQHGHGRAVHLSNGSTDSDLIYKSPGEFFSIPQTGQSNQTPWEYTITNRAGRFVLHLSPPPDSNSDSHYTIWGTYPLLWAADVQSQDSVVPVPEPTYLEYDVCLQVEENPDWRARREEALFALYRESLPPPQFVPRSERWERLWSDRR